MKERSETSAVTGAALRHRESSAKRGSKELLSNYQARDYDVVDYKMYELGDTGLLFRGPEPTSLEPGSYFTCAGAAQTFGCFCSHPFPQLMEEPLGLPGLNLGYGGAGPEFYDRMSELDEYINNSRFLIVQAMSGRSQSNSVFDCGGLEMQVRRSDGHSMGAEEAYGELLAGPQWIRSIKPRRITTQIAAALNKRKARSVLEETRQNWIESHERWFARIKVPIIFFWFSKRPPAYTATSDTLANWFGEFPQMIDEASVSAVKRLCAGYAECVTDRGSPQLLISRFTGEPVIVDPAKDRPDLRVGKPWTHNRYYPSPEMHEDAAAALLRMSNKFLA